MTGKRLDNGIKIGGVFLDFHDKIGDLSTKLRLTSEKLLMTEEDYNHLYMDREDLRAKWIATAEDLKLGIDNSSKLEEVFDQLKQRKEELENSSEFLKGRVLYLENLVTELNGHKEKSNYLLDCNEQHILHIESILSVEKSENSELRDLLYTRDEELER